MHRDEPRSSRLEHDHLEETNSDRSIGAHFLYWVGEAYGREPLLAFLWSDGVREGNPAAIQDGELVLRSDYCDRTRVVLGPGESEIITASACRWKVMFVGPEHCDEPVGFRYAVTPL